MVLEEASSGLKRERNWLITVVFAVPGPPTRRAPCRKMHSQLVQHKQYLLDRVYMQLMICSMQAACWGADFWQKCTW